MMLDHSENGNDVAVVFSAEAIAVRLEELAQEITARKLERPLIVAVLKGSFVFAADLIRALHRAGMRPEVDFLTLSSYRKSRTSLGQVEILRDLDLPVDGRNVLLIDDVLDSGRTLVFAKDLIAARGAAGILTCVLLEKKCSARSTSRRTSGLSSAATNSWSDTAWTSPIAIASSRSSAAA